MEDRDVHRLKIVDVAHIMGDVDDNSLKEELETCEHFLIDSEIDNGRQSLLLCHGHSGPKISVGKK